MAGVSTSAALYALVSGSNSAAAAPEDVKERSHHGKDGKTFRNPWPSYREWSVPWILKEMITYCNRYTRKMHVPDTTPPTVPLRKPTFLPSRKTPALRATWLGHACYYVEFPNGFRALFDPVFQPRCSPFSFMGPKRYTDMPCHIEDIPYIDAVMISHNHYDHLSYPTVMKIQSLHPSVHFFAPLGNKKWFTTCGIKNMTELDWWDTRDIRLSKAKPGGSKQHADHRVDDLAGGTLASEKPDEISATIGCLPCQHISARTPLDKAHSLWGSWSVESGGKKIWFGGDTGYRSVPQLPPGTNDYAPELNLPHCPVFASIGRLRGPFDLGLIPIGAYQPRWIMSPMHANPFDSVNIFVDTRCKRALGIHWGTWVLTEEDVLEPPQLLKTALSQKEIPEQGVFDVCDIGESCEFGSDPSQANETHSHL